MNKMLKTDPHPRARIGRRRRPGWLAVLAFGCGAAMPGPAQPSGAADAVDVADVADVADAAVPAGEAGWAEGDTVRDLLRLDAQAARVTAPRQAADWLRPGTPQVAAHAARIGRAGGYAGPEAGDAPGAADRIDVVAIYGVGKVLHADISINGRLSRYRAGRALPLASSPLGAQPYSLHAIEAPCVRLRKAGEPYTACLLHADSAHD